MLRGYNQGWGVWCRYCMCTYPVRAHYAVRGVVELIAGVEHQSLWVQGDRVLLRLAIFGRVSYEIHLVIRNLSAQKSSFSGRRHIPIKRR
jgi:hypothetical protein